MRAISADVDGHARAEGRGDRQAHEAAGLLDIGLGVERAVLGGRRSAAIGALLQG